MITATEASELVGKSQNRHLASIYNKIADQIKAKAIVGINILHLGYTDYTERQLKEIGEFFKKQGFCSILESDGRFLKIEWPCETEIKHDEALEFDADGYLMGKS